jgi:hypothetical protein
MHLLYEFGSFFPCTSLSFSTPKSLPCKSKGIFAHIQARLARQFDVVEKNVCWQSCSILCALDDGIIFGVPRCPHIRFPAGGRKSFNRKNAAMNFRKSNFRVDSCEEGVKMHLQSKFEVCISKDGRDIED